MGTFTLQQGRGRSGFGIAVSIAVLLLSAAGAHATEPCHFAQLTQGCGLRADGSAQCWAYNGYPAYVGEVPGGTFAQISGGSLHACAIRADGSVECWGCTPYLTAACYMGFCMPFWACSEDFSGVHAPPAGAFAQVAAGGSHTCGLRLDGSVECWGGRNQFGQLNAPTGTFTSIAAGHSHSCGTRPDTSVECWGDEALASYAPVPEPNDLFSAIAHGPYTDHSCALRDGEAVCWRGDNAYGQLDAPAGEFAQLSTTFRHSCGLRPDGSIECWGQNGGWVVPAGPFDQLAGDCALRADGALECWAGDTAPECPTCGNGILADAEGCDDGNLVDGDGCDSDCTPTACGNGILTTGEACDDGNFVDGDGCDSDCSLTACGNGITTNGEECDDGNLDSGDDCSPGCNTACPLVARTDCKAAGLSKLAIRDDADDERDSLKWTWSKGAKSLSSDRGNSSSINLCLYPDSGQVGAEIFLRDTQLWTYRGSGYGTSTYDDKGGVTGGVSHLAFRWGQETRTRVQLRAGGDNLPDGLLPASSFTVQLIALGSGVCWSSDFATGGSRPDSFRGKTSQ